MGQPADILIEFLAGVAALFPDQTSLYLLKYSMGIHMNHVHYMAMYVHDMWDHEFKCLL